MYDLPPDSNQTEGRFPRYHRWLAALSVLGLGAAAIAAAVMLNGEPLPPPAPPPPAAAAPAPAPPPDPGPPPPQPREVKGSVEKRQTLSGILLAAGLAPATSEQVIAALQGKFDVRKLKAGHEYTIVIEPDGTFRQLILKLSPVHVYTVRNDGGTYQGERVPMTVVREVKLVDGRIEGSLWSSMEKAGADPRLISAIADVFAYDIDFHYDPREGDRFSLLVERYVHGDQVVAWGEILAARYEGAAAGTRELFRYRPPRAKDWGYYDRKGTSAKRAFLKSPLKFTRISSGFGFRSHPTTRQYHLHSGIDYAAPVGTPVMAVADGVVVSAGWSGNGGNTVALKHAGGFTSYYLHLSKILVRGGAHVTQKTTVGLVGQTGRATGPHLHFTLRQNGKLINPAKRVVPRTEPLPPGELPAFHKAIARCLQGLDDPAFAVAEPEQLDAQSIRSL